MKVLHKSNSLLIVFFVTIFLLLLCTIDVNAADESLNECNHNIVTDVAISPTCEEDGKTEGKHCSICGTVIEQQKVIPALGHDLPKLYKKATFTEEGYIIINRCSRCLFIGPALKIPEVSTVKLSRSKLTYNGATQTVALQLLDFYNRPLVKGFEYTYTFNRAKDGVISAKDPGYYPIVVTLMGHYEGTAILSLEITPRRTSILRLSSGSKRFTAKWAKQSAQIKGYQIQYSTDKTFSDKTTKEITIRNKSTDLKTVRGLKANKVYYVHIRTYCNMNGKNIYSNWSPVKQVKTRR